MEMPNGFEDRTNLLQNIWRYNNYPVVFYRSDVWVHSKRIYCMLQELEKNLKNVYKNFNIEKALIMSLVHDDPEIITGDIVAGKKAKLNTEELQILDDDELIAVEELKRRYPNEIFGFNYSDLILEIIHKNTIEAQVVKYLDRFDALCEAVHEVRSGNVDFIIHQKSEYGELELPIEYYEKRFNNWEKNYPLLKDMISKGKIPFMIYQKIDLKKLSAQKIEYNFTNILDSSGIEYYDWWIKILSKRLDSKDFERLYIKKESY